MKTIICKRCKSKFTYENKWDKYQGKRLYCSRECANKENAEKNSKSKMGEKNPMWNKKPWNFQGHKALENSRIRYSKEYHRWSRAIKRRDKHTCQECGSKENLISHHIKGFAKYPELRYEISNGLTLCRDCHKLTDNYKKNINYQ